jgi:tetratricopeptide (TPR) repeat protein
MRCPNAIAPKLALLAALVLAGGVRCAADEGKAVPDYAQFLEAFDYDHPAESEKRLEALARAAEAAGDRETLAEILAHIARTQGLQNRFDEGHATLARAESFKPQSKRATARIAIERGRLFRSGGEPERAKPFFIAAFENAQTSGDDYLALDAIHMVALVVPFNETLDWAERGYAFAAQSKHPRAVHWVAVLHNNIGWSYIDREDHAAALNEFEAALAAYKTEGADAETIRISEYSIGFAWRKLRRFQEALDLQMRIARAAEAAGKADRFFENEVAECLLALGRKSEAKEWAKKALGKGSEALPADNKKRLQTIADGRMFETWD